MRLLPTPSNIRRNARASMKRRGNEQGSDSLGQGMDITITLVLFLGIGYGLDRWLGTGPWLMIGLFLLAAVGTFASMTARYSARMDELDAERRERRDAGTAGRHV